METSLDFILLHVPDLTAARAFYTDQIGLAVEDENPAFIQFRRPNGAIFALQADPDAASHTGVELWWLVPNADAAHNAFQSRGVPIAEPLADQPFGRTFSVTDPAGNTLSFFAPRADFKLPLD